MSFNLSVLIQYYFLLGGGDQNKSLQIINVLSELFTLGKLLGVRDWPRLIPSDLLFARNLFVFADDCVAVHRAQKFHNGQKMYFSNRLVSTDIYDFDHCNNLCNKRFDIEFFFVNDHVKEASESTMMICMLDLTIHSFLPVFSGTLR